MKTKDISSGCKLIGLRQVNQIFDLKKEPFVEKNFRESLKSRNFADLIFATSILCQSREVANSLGKSNMYPHLI